MCSQFKSRLHFLIILLNILIFIQTLTLKIYKVEMFEKKLFSYTEFDFTKQNKQTLKAFSSTFVNTFEKTLTTMLIFSDIALIGFCRTRNKSQACSYNLTMFACGLAKFISCIRIQFGIYYRSAIWARANTLIHPNGSITS